MSTYRAEIVPDGKQLWGYEIYRYDGDCCSQCQLDEEQHVEDSGGYASQAIAKYEAEQRIDELNKDGE